MSLTPIIITGIVCVLIGVAIGSLLSGFSKEPKEKPSLPASEGDWIERVTLVSDHDGKAVFPQFQGQVYQSEKELPLQQRQILVKALGEMRTWLGEPEATPPTPGVQALPPSTEAQPTVDAATVEPELLVQALTPPATKVSLNPIDFFAKVIQSEVKPVSSAPKSIVAQIDEILQDKLLDSPMEKRGIRLLEFPGKGMVVMVGLDQFGGVDEVPDEEIRQLIRAAVKEWEDRFEAGGKP